LQQQMIYLSDVLQGRALWCNTTRLSPAAITSWYSQVC